MYKKTITLAFTLIIGLLFVDVYANPIMSYDKSDFEIEGGVLKGFTEQGLQKHNGLSERNLIIPESWNITEISDGAFATVNSNEGEDVIANTAEIVNSKVTKYSDNVIIKYNDPLVFENAGNVLTQYFKFKPGRTGKNLVVDKSTILTNKKVLTYSFNYIKLPTNMQKIGQLAFYNTNDATNARVDIQGVNLIIDNFSFYRYNGNTTIKFINPNEIKTLGLYCFYNTTGTTEIAGCDFSSNTKMEVISDGAFLKTKVVGLRLPNILKRVGNVSFQAIDMENGKLTLPNTITDIGNSAFAEAKCEIVGFKDLSRIRTLFDFTFYKTVIRDLTLPENLTRIGNSCFFEVSCAIFNFNNNISSIGKSAFEGTKSGKRLNTKLPDSLLTLEMSAFCNSNLFGNLDLGTKLAEIKEFTFSGEECIYGTLTIPNNIRKLGRHAVSRGNITQVIVDTQNSNLFEIEEDAFHSALDNEQELNLPNSLITIGSGAFSECNITNNPFSESSQVKSIGSSAFRSAIQLRGKSLRLPSTIKNIETSAFESCNLGKVEFDENMVLDKLGSSAFYSAITGYSDLRIPTITQIGDVNEEQTHRGTFEDCKLNNVTIKGNDVTLGSNIFKSSSVRRVNIEGSLRVVGFGAFEKCNELSFFDSSKLSVGADLCDNSFKKTTSLREFNFDKVSNIGVSAFQESGLEVVDLKRNIVKIGNGAFSSSKVLTIKYNPSLNYIQDSLFNNTSPIQITLGEHVKSIKPFSFGQATLLNLDFIKNGSNIEENAFNNATISVASLRQENRYGLNSFSNSKINTLTSELIEIPNSLMYGATIGDFTLSNTVSIGSKAFQGCNINSLAKFPTTLKYIKPLAFSEVTSGSELTLDNHLEEIGDGAFSDSNWSSIVIRHLPDNTGKDLFKKISNKANDLPRIVFGDSITRIPESMFKDRVIQDLTFGESITNIDKEAFSGARVEWITSETLKGLTNLRVIGDSAFRNIGTNPGIKKLSFPNSVEIIGANAFSTEYGETGTYPFYVKEIELGDNIKRIGANAFGGHGIGDYSRIPDYLKTPTMLNNIKKMFSSGDQVYYQKFELNPIGTFFKVGLRDYNGNVPQNFMIGKIRSHDNDYFSFINPNQGGSNELAHSPLGSWSVTVNNNKRYIPSLKNNIQVIRTINDNPLAWINNPPTEGHVSLINQIDYTRPGTQNMNLRIDFVDDSYSLVTMPINLVTAKADAWVPQVDLIQVKRGEVIDISTAVKNAPSLSEAKIVYKDNLVFNQIGMQKGRLRYEFIDKTIKDVEVNVNVTGNKADEWLPQIETLTIEKEISERCVDLISLIKNLPQANTTTRVITPVCYNQNKGEHIGLVRVTFTEDNSYKDVRLVVTVIDKASSFKVKLKELTSKLNEPVNLLDAVIEKPDGTQFEVLRSVDVQRLGKQTGRIKATFIDLTTKEYDVFVNVIDPNSEAAKFIPKTKKLFTYLNEPIDITKGLLNKPSTANVETIKDVNVSEIGIDRGIIKVIFADQSHTLIPIEVEVRYKDFYEVDDETSIPPGYVKVTFTPSTGVRFIDHSISKIFACKLNTQVPYKYFPKAETVPGYYGAITWTPAVDTVIQSQVNFVATAEVDGRTKAQKFLPETKTLLVYQNDYSTSLTEALVNPPVDMQELRVKIEANRHLIGIQDGLLELVFDDSSKLDIPVKVQVIARANSKALSFNPNVKQLETNVGGDIDIKKGLLNDPIEYDSVRIIRDVTTTTAGKVIGLIEVSFDDGSSREVAISVFVKGTSDVGTLADKYNLTTKILEVNTGETVDIKKGVTSDLTGITLIVKQTVDTTFAGQKAGIVVLKFSDDSTLEAAIAVMVKGNTNLNINNSGGSSGGSSSGSSGGNTGQLAEIINTLKDSTINNNTIIKKENLGRQIIKGKVETKGYLEMSKDGNFKPDAKITRADFVVMFTSAKELKGDADLKFVDVQKNANYAKALAACYRAGVINGYEDGTFKPQNPITRAEFTKIISILEGVTPGSSEFPDVTKTHWARKYINSAYVNGFINGYEDGSFRPNGYITRAEAVKVLNRYTNKIILDEEVIKNVTVAKYKDVMDSHWAYREITSALNSLKLDKYIWEKDKLKLEHYKLSK